jgi:hypothetical protein
MHKFVLSSSSSSSSSAFFLFLPAMEASSSSSSSSSSRDGVDTRARAAREILGAEEDLEDGDALGNFFPPRIGASEIAREFLRFFLSLSSLVIFITTTAFFSFCPYPRSSSPLSHRLPASSFMFGRPSALLFCIFLRY